MSKSNRDQRGRLHSGKKCPESQNGGCVFCLTGKYKRSARRHVRHQKTDSIDEQRSSP